MKRITLIHAAVLCLMSCTAQQKNNTTMKQSNILVAYFSATGTTKAKAEAIANATGATLYEITPAERYTAADIDWRDDNSRSSIEMRDEHSRPALEGNVINAQDYDIIFIGYPIWWDLCPRVVNTWIESQQLDGKALIPFATSGSSTITNSVRDLKRLYPSLNWQDGKLLNCSSAKAVEWACPILK